jgi:hypothetical protein
VKSTVSDNQTFVNTLHANNFKLHHGRLDSDQRSSNSTTDMQLSALDRKLLEDIEYHEGPISNSVLKIKLLFDDPKHMDDTV